MKIGPQKTYPIDQHSETWRSIHDWIDDRLKLHRDLLEMPLLPKDETEGARGAIDELKELKKLGALDEALADTSS